MTEKGDIMNKLPITTINTIEDLKFSYFGHVNSMGVLGKYILYVAEIAEPYADGGWECAEWYLVDDNNNVTHIAHCDGYDGIEWLSSDEELSDLLGDDLVEEVKGRVVPYEFTGRLLSEARADQLEYIDEDYDGPVQVWVERFFYEGTCNAPNDDFLLDDQSEPITFESILEAQEYIDDLDNGIYLLSNGEYACPTYRIVKA